MRKALGETTQDYSVPNPIKGKGGKCILGYLIRQQRTINVLTMACDVLVGLIEILKEDNSFRQEVKIHQSSRFVRSAIQDIFFLSRRLSASTF